MCHNHLPTHTVPGHTQFHSVQPFLFPVLPSETMVQGFPFSSKAAGNLEIHARAGWFPWRSGERRSSGIPGHTGREGWLIWLAGLEELKMWAERAEKSQRESETDVSAGGEGLGHVWRGR